MTTSARRPAADRCPGLLRAHRAEDGSLVRIRVPGGQLTTATLAGLSDASRRYGNGDLQLTSRGNVQIRGVDEVRLQDLSDEVAALGLLPSLDHERVRNIVASPLTGLSGGQVDLRPTVQALDRALCGSPVLAELSGRFLFVLDDGRGDVAGLALDLGYQALGANHGLLLAGDQATPVALAAVPVRLVALAERFLAARAALHSTAWHVRELPRPLLPRATSRPVTDGGPLALGVVDDVASVGVPLAMLTPDQVTLVGRLATTVVITPWRGLLLPGAGARLADLAAGGLVVDDASGWAGLSACVGAPFCAKAHADTRALATRLADDRVLPGPVHVSGCERRCGAPTGPHLDLVASP